MKNILKTKHAGVGGMFFLTIVSICVFCMTFSINISRTSTVIAISDNISNLIATKVAIYCHNTTQSKFFQESENPSIKTADGFYYPLADFKNIANNYGFLSLAPSTCSVSFTPGINDAATVSIGSFICDWGEKITPHTQTSTAGIGDNNNASLQ